MNRPLRLLDCFSGAGGAATGYYRAGFTEILGIDIAPQPRYPFAFKQTDALEFLAGVKPGEYDLIHCSPPCQRYSQCAGMPNRTAAAYPDLVPDVRRELQRIGTPWVIENVLGARLSGVMLCGQQFGLPLYRHRVFEASCLLVQAPHTRHAGRLAAGGLNRYFGVPGQITTVAGHQFSRASGSVAMGIDWMTRDELAEAIPPAYAHFIGLQMRAQIVQVAA